MRRLRRWIRDSGRAGWCGAGLGSKKMKPISKFVLIAILASICSTTQASISMSLSGNQFSDAYSATFEISDPDTTAGGGKYAATLTNTSLISLSDALIDLFAFNLEDPDPVLGTDLIIDNFSNLEVKNIISI